MKRVTLIATALVLAVMAVLSSRVAAQQPDTRDRTILTFSNSVELPGRTLPAGTYVFRLADTPLRNRVEVWNQDETSPIGHFFFVRAERPQAAEETIISFKETAEGTTPAIQYWYYPGQRSGREFIYPKDQAMKIAARTGQKVLSYEGDTASDTSVSSVDAQGNLSPWQREASASASAAPAQGQAQVQGTAGLSADAAAQTTQSAATQPADDATLRNAPAAAQPSAAAGSLTGNRGATTQPSTSARADVSADASVGATQDRAVGTSGVANSQAPATSSAAPSSGVQANQSAQSTTERPMQMARANQLPRTASPLPLSGIVGLLSLAGAFGVRRFAAARQ